VINKRNEDSIESPALTPGNSGVAKGQRVSKPASVLPEKFPDGVKALGLCW
jgi:hypothetical protein